MKKYGKNYKNAAKSVKGKTFGDLTEIVKAVQESSKTKFASTAEIHLSLNIDPKQADQMVRSTVALPHGTGKKLKIAAVVSDDKVKSAKDAGASAAGAL